MLLCSVNDARIIPWCGLLIELRLATLPKCSSFGKLNIQNARVSVCPSSPTPGARAFKLELQVRPWRSPKFLLFSIFAFSCLCFSMCETLTTARFAFVIRARPFVKHFRKFKNQNGKTETLRLGAAFLTRRSPLVRSTKIRDTVIFFETIWDRRTKSQKFA